MNTALKHWKEAATLILAAGATARQGRTLDSLSGSPNNNKSNWPHQSAFDYEVLLLKRSRKSGFMPNAYVFPGGLIDSSDFSSDWLDIFKSFQNLTNFGLGYVKQPAESRPPIFATDRDKLGSPIPGEVAFRICALRETFEESGVLLSVPKTEENSLIKSVEHKQDCSQITLPPHLSKVNLLHDEKELIKWRALVNKNPLNFIKMCKHLELLPNIWALHEWGNWLTPVGVYAKERRYDTAFFLCCLQEIPHTLQDEKEIVHFKWSTPSEILHRYRAQELWIAPPQFYDLSRMCRRPALSGLHSFARQRAAAGCEQWLPVRVVTNDGNAMQMLLPGDKLYPVDGLGHVNTNADLSLDDSQGGESALHRIVFHDPYSMSVQVTITPKYNHLLPCEGPAVHHDPSSRL